MRVEEDEDGEAEEVHQEEAMPMLEGYDSYYVDRDVAVAFDINDTWEAGHLNHNQRDRKSQMVSYSTRLRHNHKMNKAYFESTASSATSDDEDEDDDD